MYSLIDRPVEDLSNGSRFLLWAMRGWTHALSRGHCPPAALAPGFSASRALTALPGFHQTMTLFNRDGLENLGFAPLRCGMIAEGEALLLALWRDMASRKADRARETLSLILAEEACGRMERTMVETAARLAAADLAPLGISARVIGEIRR